MASTQIVTVETLARVLDAFNRHDLDAIMTFFADDASFDTPRGSDPWGSRHVGRAAVRKGFAARFFTTPMIGTGCAESMASRNGCSPEPPRPGNESWSAGATTGGSGMV